MVISKIISLDPRLLKLPQEFKLINLATHFSAILTEGSKYEKESRKSTKVKTI